MSAWKYEIKYGPEGETDYAWIYKGDLFVATMRTHHAVEIVRALSASPAGVVKRIEPTYTQAEYDEVYELGKRDGYSEAVQQIDQLTGGDGEYRYCSDHDPERHTPGPAEMIQRIVDRFETLNLIDDASKTGRDQEWGMSVIEPAGPQCCMCGKKGLSTVEGDGGTECELSDGRWVCSVECWDRAVEPAGVGVETPPPSSHLVGPPKWRVFEDVTHGWWGIEEDIHDGNTILYPKKMNREPLDEVVRAHNAALAVGSGGRPMKKVREAANAYVAESGFEHSGGVIETAFEAGACWATECLSAPYGYVFGGCTFLPNGSPLVTEYVAAHSLPVFLQPSENVMETFKEVVAQKIGDDSIPSPQPRAAVSLTKEGEQ